MAWDFYEWQINKLDNAELLNDFDWLSKDYINAWTIEEANVIKITILEKAKQELNVDELKLLRDNFSNQAKNLSWKAKMRMYELSAWLYNITSWNNQTLENNNNNVIKTPNEQWWTTIIINNWTNNSESIENIPNAVWVWFSREWFYYRKWLWPDYRDQLRGIVPLNWNPNSIEKWTFNEYELMFKHWRKKISISYDENWILSVNDWRYSQTLNLGYNQVHLWDYSNVQNWDNWTFIEFWINIIAPWIQNNHRHREIPDFYNNQNNYSPNQRPQKYYHR